MRPTGPWRPWGIAVALAATLTLIARTTGSGWAMVLVSGMIATFATATVWPALALRRTRVAIVAPRDATANRPVEVDVSLTGGSQPAKARVLEPPSGWFAAEPGASGPVAVTPSRRGVVSALDVEVRCAGPLGLVWWRRIDRLVLPGAIEIGPEPLDTPVPPVHHGDLGDSRPPRKRLGSETVRSVREYVPGDPARLVHWGATARRSELMVKELENPEGAVLAIVVDLRGDDDDARELAASRAAGMANAAIRGDLHVVLLTAEDDGPRIGPVRSTLEVGRRLARAASDAPPDGPVPYGATKVVVAARR